MKTKDTMSSELTMANWLNEVHTSMPKSRNKSTVRKDWNEKPSVYENQAMPNTHQFYEKQMIDVKWIKNGKVNKWCTVNAKITQQCYHSKGMEGKSIRKTFPLTLLGSVLTGSSPWTARRKQEFLCSFYQN